MTDDATFPPMLWSVVVAERARATPARVFCETARDDWPTRTGRDAARAVSYAQLARAVDRVSWWLDEVMGRDEDAGNYQDDPAAFVYVGPNDLRYVVALVAAQKTGRQMVIAELNRLTNTALLELLAATRCRVWVGGSAEHTAQGEAVLSERPETALATLAPLEELLADEGGDVPAYPFSKTWAEASRRPAFVIHSSGTTGTPKPLRYTPELLAVAHTQRRLPDGSVENPELITRPMLGTRALWAAPPQWIGGLHGYLVAPLMWDVVPIWPPVDAAVPPPPDVLEGLMEHLRPDGGFYVPTTLRELCRRPAGLELLRRHAWVSSAGAPLDDAVGDALCEAVALVISIGATETYMWPMRTLEDRRDWRYIRPDPRLGWRLEPIRGGGGGNDHDHDNGPQELVFDRRPRWRRFQGAFVMYPEQAVWRTSDLFVRHPTNPELIRHCGRRDDLVKLQWLAKVRAGDIEAALHANPHIAGALVGGEGRPTPFVILQPHDEETAAGRTPPNPEELWALVDGLNAAYSTEIRIPRENIIVADAQRPLKRLGKGTLDRRGILADYAGEIARLYSRGEAGEGERN